VHALDKEFEKLSKKHLTESINALYGNKMISYREQGGVAEIVLNDFGKTQALSYELEKIKISKPAKWDKKWRIVIFDIPHALKKKRDILRFRLKHLGFVQLQRSVFVFPYECLKELTFIIEFYSLRKFVRYIVAEHIDSGLDLKKHFGLF